MNLNVSPRVSDRRDILYKRYGGFMTVSDIMAELAVSRNTAVKFARTIPSRSPTGKKIYDIADVAKKIEESYCPPEEP